MSKVLAVVSVLGQDQKGVVAQFAVPVDAYAAPIGRLFLTVEPAPPPAAPTGPAVMESATA